MLIHQLAVRFRIEMISKPPVASVNVGNFGKIRNIGNIGSIVNFGNICNIVNIFNTF